MVIVHAPVVMFKTLMNVGDPGAIVNPVSSPPENVAVPNE